MVYENDGELIRKEEKVLGVSLIVSAIIGVILGILLENVILGFSILTIVGMFIGSLINIMNRNQKIVNKK